MLLELFLKPFEQSKRIGCRTCKASDNLTAFSNPAHFARIGLHHSVAHGDLPITCNNGFLTALYANDGCAVPLG